MTRPDGGDPEPHADAWGTWEELLLAFAVNRHGTAAWDSIASELQKRTSDRDLCLTAQNCRLKYLDLRRRFVAPNGDFNDDDAKSNIAETGPLLEELRKLRVAELRREVQRYDLNIESLELKMKWMEEERHRSLKDDRTESDLHKEAPERGDCQPEPDTGEPASGEELEKDRLSVNESNSTGPQADKSIIGEKDSKLDRTGGDEVRYGRKVEEPTPLNSEADRKSVREDSCNGSSNSIDAKPEPVSGSVGVVGSQGESGDVGGDEAATKENSDVQSSASKSRKEVGNDKVLREITSGDERDHENQSLAVKDFSAESHPLMNLLRAIRLHRLGSVFERRLLSQESSKYNKMILQHVDLETVEARLKEGLYSSSGDKFFRDLLLLANNALVYYPGNSSEADAAAEIRGMVAKEISQRNSKSDSSTGKQVSLQSLSAPKKDDAAAEPSSSVILKPTISGPLIVCRKRSSILKAVGANKKRDRTSLLAEEREEKPPASASASKPEEEEPKITKKRRRERFSSVSANSKKNNKNQGATAATSSENKNSSADSGKQPAKGGSSSSLQAEAKVENKKSQSQPALESKKRGAAIFLNRMNQSSSPTNNGLLLDALKNTPLTSDSTGSRGGFESKKSKNTKRVEKKVSASRRQVKEKVASPVKRTVGRPPKRAAPPPASLGKRGRERGEAESASSSKQPKKRSRKL